MIDFERVKQHLNLDIDEGDTDTPAYVNFLMEVSEAYVDSSVGTAYKTIQSKDKLADILKLKLIDDMWENRSTVVEIDKRDRIVTTIFQSLGVTS